MMNQFLAVGAFGKLPCYGDFLEGSVFQSSSRAMKDWVYGGREALGLEGEGEQGTKPRETLGRRFLFGLPGSVDLVAGVVRPSADQGRRREFPFMVFTHFPRRLYARNYALLPMALAPVWDALDDAWDSLANVATRAAFKEVLEATRVPSPVPPAEIRGAYSSTLQESISRTVDEDTRLLEGVLRGLPEVVGRLKKGGDGLMVELPVSRGGAAACFDAAFWIDLVNHQFLWRRFEPVVFLGATPGEKNNRALLNFGILSPSDYAFIMGCEGPPARVTRLAEASVAGGEPAVPAGMGMTYAQVLARRFSSGG
jgi:hypothetical protein